MNTTRSLALTCAFLAGGALHGLVPGNTAPQPNGQTQVAKVKTATQTWEYHIAPEPSLEEANELGEKGWEYAGIYGQSDLGTAVSLTLWKRPLPKK